LYLKACFREMQLKHHRYKSLSLKLSNMTATFHNRNLQSAFQMINNFAISKANVADNRKKLSSGNMGECLRKIWRRKLLQHYTHLRRQVLANKITDNKKKLFFAHFISQSTRDAFDRWKKRALYE